MFNRTLGRLLGFYRAIVIGFGLVLLVGITLHHLGSSPPGLSPPEVTTRTQSAEPRQILNQPLNSPHKFVAFATHKIKPSHNGTLRLASYLFALVFSLAFYYLARGWFGKIVGLLGSLIFVLSPFFLIPARLASEQIMFFWPIALMAAYYWLNKTDKKSRVWMLLALLIGLAFYTPGLIWWIAASVIICRKKLLTITGELPQSIVAAGLLLIVLLLLPAGWAVFNDWHFIKDLAALPTHWLSPIKLAKNLVWMVLSFAVKTPYHDQLMISRLPIIDLIQTGLLVFGVYAMATAAKSKAAAFGLSVILAVIIAAINNNIEFLLLGLPAIGLFMTAGLRYLYIEWRSVFPLNPIPKSLAVVLMSVLVGIQLVYGVTYSLIAWPHTPDTKTVYVLK